MADLAACNAQRSELRLQYTKLKIVACKAKLSKLQEVFEALANAKTAGTSSAKERRSKVDREERKHDEIDTILYDGRPSKAMLRKEHEFAKMLIGRIDVNLWGLRPKGEPQRPVARDWKEWFERVYANMDDLAHFQTEMSKGSLNLLTGEETLRFNRDYDVSSSTYPEKVRKQLQLLWLTQMPRVVVEAAIQDGHIDPDKLSK